MTKGGGVVRTVLFLLVIGVAGLVTFGITYKDELRHYIRMHVKVVPQKNSIELDLGQFNPDNLKGTISMYVYNGLPLGATLVKLNYSVFMNGAEVCRGLQADSHTPIAPSATSTLKIGFAIDSKKFRAAALKTSPDKALKLALSLLDRMKGRKPAENPLQGMIRIAGHAEIHVLTSSVEIPVEFSKNL